MVVYVRYYWYYIPHLEEVTKTFYPHDTPSILQVSRNTSLLISNTNNAMGHARPSMPHVVHIGGIHCRPAEPLPDDINRFIEGSSEHGIIYFSLGHSITANLPTHILQAIIRVLAKIPQRILWKQNEIIKDLPSNIMISKWFPQQDVLGHNKTRLFITQAGLFSMQEASYHGVPVLALPILGDHPVNARLAHNLGYCEYISICDFTEDAFQHLIQKIILNPEYKNNAMKVSRLMKEYPTNPKEELVWWINYIVRHRGNPMVASLHDNTNGLQKLDLDVVICLNICIILSVIILMYILRQLIRYIYVWYYDFKKKVQ